MNLQRAVFGVSALCAAVLTVLLMRPGGRGPGTAAGAAKPLLVCCAAGLKGPMEAIAADFERERGVRVQLQFGGSGALLSGLRLTDAGDLFLAADESYLRTAEGLGWLTRTLPLARQRPVIAVAKGNPRNIRSFEDLMRTGMRISSANPDAASIGRTLRALLEKKGVWADFESRVTVFKPTVNDVANDVKLGAVDAGVVWDATARQYPELDWVAAPEFGDAAETIAVGVLKRSKQPESALQLALFMASDRGLAQFRNFHYETAAAGAAP